MPTYIYAITGADHPLRLDGLQGVGDPPSPLRTLIAGDVAAVVSDAPEGLRAKRRDVLAHEAVLEALMADGGPCRCASASWGRTTTRPTPL